MKTPLAHILITRPSGQEASFRQACERRELRVSHLPCLRIEPINQTSSVLDQVESADFVLFTSINAVQQLQTSLALPLQDKKVFAIGQATALALTALGQKLEMQPQAPYNSEAFLQQIQKQPAGTLLIIKGQGGRQYLHNQLSAQGWSVDSCDVYTRTLPEPDPQLLDAVFASSPPDVVSVTSNEGLQNLLLLADRYQDTLLSLPLIVNSQRCASLAKKSGFGIRALVACPAGDEGQLQQLDSWLMQI